MGNSSNSKLCKPKFQFDELLDDVDCSVTDLFRSVDNMISDTRMYMQYTDNRFSGDYDGRSESENTYRNGRQLRRHCLKSQDILNTNKQTAVEDIQKLLHKFRRSAKTKTYMGIEDNDNYLKLDTYMKESKPNLPVICSTEDMDCEKLREKIRQYEEELMRFKEQTESLDKQLRASTEEIKQLKSTIEDKITENKDLLVKYASMENKLQSCRNEKQISQHVRVNAKDSEHHHGKCRENVVQKERKQSQCRENENLKRENEDIRHETGRLRAEFLRLEENTESRLEYDSLRIEKFERLKRDKQAMEQEIKEITREGKVKTAEIVKLKEDLKRLGNNKDIEQELSCMRALNESLSHQEKESSLEIKQVRQEIAPHKFTIQSKVEENKDLLVKVDRLEKEVDSLTNKLQQMWDTRGNVQYIEQHRKNNENVTLKSKEHTEGLEKEKKNQDEHKGSSSISTELLKPKEDAEYCQTSVKLGKEENKRLEKQIHLIEKEIKENRLQVNSKDNEIRKLKDDLEDLVRDINEQKKVCKFVEGERDALRRENETIQQQLIEKDTEFGQRISALEIRLAKVNLDHKKEREELVKQQEHKLNEALETNTKLEKNILDLETSFVKKTDENIELSLNVTELSHLEEKYRRELIIQKNVDENKNKRIENLENSLEKASLENERMKEESLQNAETNRNEKEKLLKDIKGLKDESDFLEKKLKSISKKNSDLQTMLKVQTENNEAKIKELTRDIDALRERNSDTEKALVSVRHDKRELQQMYDTVKLELDHLKSTKTMHIQLYHHSRVSLVSKVEIELKALLKKEMENEMFELDFVECGVEKEVDLNKPLLILCISASRLGTDASNAIQSLKLTPKMALLVFHHKDRHALPNQASEHVLTGQDFKRLGGIYDIGFLSSKGIYSCELNDLNIKSIVHFLHKEGTRCLREVSS